MYLIGPNISLTLNFRRREKKKKKKTLCEEKFACHIIQLQNSLYYLNTFSSVIIWVNHPVQLIRFFSNVTVNFTTTCICFITANMSSAYHSLPIVRHPHCHPEH